MTIHENVKEILHNITKAKSASQKLSVIAVTKSVDTKQTKEIIDAGICHIAENRVDSFLKKYHELEEERLTWHFIGNLQRRKVKEIIDLVDYFHALDSLKLAEEIEKRATHPIKCFIEINVSGEASKQGFSIEEVRELLPQFSKFEKIRIVGLMTMAPIDAEPEQLHKIFKTLKQLQEEIAKKNITNIPCTELSMGMSRDYIEAIQEGSTFVRIGRNFFK